MAKTIQQLEIEISEIDEKIREFNKRKKEKIVRLQELQDKEVLELARQIRKAGKIEEAKKLLGDQKSKNEASKASSTPLSYT